MEEDADADAVETRQEAEPQQEQPQVMLNRPERNQTQKESYDSETEKLVLYEYNKAVAEYEEYLPLERPGIPRVTMVRRVKGCIAAANECLGEDYRQNL